MQITEPARKFMQENHYRNCQDRSCANCKKMYFIRGKMTCTGGGDPPAHFNVHQFATCDAWELKRPLY